MLLLSAKRLLVLLTKESISGERAALSHNELQFRFDDMQCRQILGLRMEVVKMKKLLLATVFAIASIPGNAADYRPNYDPHASEWQAAESGYDKFIGPPGPEGDESEGCDNEETRYGCPPKPPARVTVAPPYQGPLPIGWVYGPYTQCADPPRCSMGVVNVPADGLNVRIVPNGPPVMSLVNGTPLIPLQKQGDWLLVASACDLTPTWAWSWNAGVPLNRCWVYF